MIAINAVLFLNNTNVSGANPKEVADKHSYALRFWEAVIEIDVDVEDGAKQKPVAAQSVVLKALAKLSNDVVYGRQKNNVLFNALMDGVARIYFSHDEPIWRYYQLNTDQRERMGLTPLANYLPSDAGRNLAQNVEKPLNQNWRRGLSLLVAWGGIEPPTQGFSILCSTD